MHESCVFVCVCNLVSMLYTSEWFTGVQVKNEAVVVYAGFG